MVGEGALLLSLSENDVLEVQLPHENWEGRETLSFTVSDPDGALAVVQAVFSVLAGYRPPVAYPDDVATQEDAGVVVDALANDQLPPRNLFSSQVSLHCMVRIGCWRMEPSFTCLKQIIMERIPSSM